MSEPFIKPSGLGVKVAIRVIIGAVVIAGVLGITWVAIRMNDYRQSGGESSLGLASAQVAISNPPTGAWAELGNTLTVDVSAIGPDVYNSIELWLNGELAGVQAAPAGGIQPFITQFSWTPTKPGYHTLMSVGVDGNGGKVFSSQVMVLILQGEEEEIDLVAGMSTVPVVEPKAPGGGYSPPGGPLPGDPIYPAGIWAGTIGDLTTSLSTASKPFAPELAFLPGDCAASLFIHDLSDNEEGFYLFRQIINNPGWEKIAKISSQSEVEWLGYLDEGVSGAMAYYVSAFNSKGEAQSNPVLVNIDSSGCPNEPTEQVIERVDLALTLTNSSADQLYCYMSNDGVNWSRWPAIGFLSPDENGEVTELPIMAQRKAYLGSEISEKPSGLMMECWGWQGGVLTNLGGFSVGELQPDLTGKQIVLGMNIVAKLTFKTEALKDPSEIFQIGDFGLPDISIELDPGSISPIPLSPISPELPRATLSLTFDKEVCGQYIPPEAQNFLGKTLFCFPYPDYDPDKGGNSPQPYLVWGFDLEPTCVGGMSENCKSYWELLSMAEETEGEVGFTILAMTGAQKTVWNVTEPNQTMFVVPPNACLGDTKYSVRLWYRPGNQGVAVSSSPSDNISQVGEVEITPGEIFYGPYSNWVSVPCLSPDLPTFSIFTETHYQVYEITYDWFELHHVNDGMGETSYEYEVYGYFRVKAPSMGQWETEYCFTPEFGNCNQEPHWGNQYRYLIIADWETTSPNYEVYNGYKFYESGHYELEEEMLCQSDTKYDCTLNGESTMYLYDNNTIRVAVKEGDVLKFKMMLVDYDHYSDDDVLCDDSYTAEPYEGQYAGWVSGVQLYWNQTGCESFVDISPAKKNP